MTEYCVYSISLHLFLNQIKYNFFSHSAGGDSWDSSGDEDDNMFGSKAKVCTAVETLLHHLQQVQLYDGITHVHVHK